MRHVAPALALALSLVVNSDAAGRWQLDFEPGRIGTITTHGAEGPGNYLYMSFKVSNNSGETVPVRLRLDVATEVPGRAYRAGYDPLVFQKVSRRVFGGEMKRLSEVQGDLADGDSFECLVTFGKIDPQVAKFDITVGGLVDRVFQDQHKMWIEDKVLTLSYSRPGDEHERARDPVVFRGKQWRILAPRREVPRS